MPPPKQYSQEPTSNFLTPKNFRPPWLFHWWFFACGIYYFIGAQELVRNTWNFHLVNPAAAAITAHSLLSLGFILNSFIKLFFSVNISLLRQIKFAFPTALLIIVCIGISGQNNLQNMYNPSKPWNAFEGYKLGLLIRQVTQPGELVVTINNALGDPVSIYYSRRRGWVFPPNRPGEWFSQLPEDDSQSIKLFDELRVSGARWLGIVHEQRVDIWKKHPQFVDYIDRTCKLRIEKPEGVVYHILSIEELNKNTS